MIAGSCNNSDLGRVALYSVRLGITCSWSNNLSDTRNLPQHIEWQILAIKNPIGKMGNYTQWPSSIAHMHIPLAEDARTLHWPRCAPRDWPAWPPQTLIRRMVFLSHYPLWSPLSWASGYYSKGFYQGNKATFYLGLRNHSPSFAR